MRKLNHQFTERVMVHLIISIVLTKFFTFISYTNCSYQIDKINDPTLHWHYQFPWLSPQLNPTLLHNSITNHHQNRPNSHKTMQQAVAKTKTPNIQIDQELKVLKSAYVWSNNQSTKEEETPYRLTYRTSQILLHNTLHSFPRWVKEKKNKKKRINSEVPNRGLGEDQVHRHWQRQQRARDRRYQVQAEPELCHIENQVSPQNPSESVSWVGNNGLVERRVKNLNIWEGKGSSSGSHGRRLWRLRESCPIQRVSSYAAYFTIMCRVIAKRRRSGGRTCTIFLFLWVCFFVSLLVWMMVLLLLCS